MPRHARPSANHQRIGSEPIWASSLGRPLAKGRKSHSAGKSAQPLRQPNTARMFFHLIRIAM